MSFRDPGGRVVAAEGRVLRFLREPAAAELSAFRSLPVARALEEDGRVVRSRPLANGNGATAELPAAAAALARAETWSAVVEHDPIPFVSYPYEWPPEMLHAAAALTLDLAESLLPVGWQLKDASPFNVLFRGPEPVFVDVLSFERRDVSLALWTPYAQFVRTFVLPLLANRHYGITMRQAFEGSREGLSPEQLYRLASPLRRLSPRFLSLVTLPAVLGRRRGNGAAAAPPSARAAAGADPERTAFVLRGVFRHLRRALAAAAPPAGAESTWTEYTSDGTHVSSYHETKRALLRDIAATHRPKAALDVGCNDGHVSAVLARAGARVVAIDADERVVGAAWRRLRAEKLDVLPLVVNLADPPAGTGWRNRECTSFLERATGAFDAVLMLAVIHHLMVTAGIPLDEVVRLASELTTDLAVIEYVPPHDPMFRAIARGRDAMYAWLTPASFEAALAPVFSTVAVHELPGGDRRLYVLRRRAA